MTKIHIESRRVDATCRGMLSNGWQLNILVAFWICSVSETRDVAHALICTTICKSTISDFPELFCLQTLFCSIFGGFTRLTMINVDEFSKPE